MVQHLGIYDAVATVANVGETYIVLNTKLSNLKGSLNHDIYLWLGKEASQVCSSIRKPVIIWPINLDLYE